MKAREITVTMGREERKLRFDLNAMATFEEVVGGSTFEGIALNSVRELRALVYACAAAAEQARDPHGFREPTLSLYEVGDLLTDEGTLQGIRRDVVRLVKENTPDPDEVQAAQEAAEGAEGEDGPPDPSTTAPADTSREPTPTESSSSD